MMSNDGLIIENMDLSHIHLPVFEYVFKITFLELVNVSEADVLFL